MRAATADLRGKEVMSWLGRAMGTPADPKARQALTQLQTWARAGAQRRDVDADGKVDAGAAVGLMDAWWPLLVRRIFEPALGADLVSQVDEKVNKLPVKGTSTFFFDGWWGYVQKDLRRVTGRKVRGWPAKAYCGRGSRSACRRLLTASLLDAVAASAGKEVRSTCPETEPPSCDQIVPTTAGAVGVDPFPFHNRGTFHQLVQVGRP